MIIQLYILKKLTPCTLAGQSEVSFLSREQVALIRQNTLDERTITI